jgi:ABC-type antimicrobial peptide transport system permease subunit
VGAVLKCERLGYFSNSRFPVYVSKTDFENMTGVNAITEIYVNCPENSTSSVENELNALAGEEEFNINNQAQHNIRTEKLKTVFCRIILLLGIFILLSVIVSAGFYNYYYMSKRKGEIRLLTHVGVDGGKLRGIFSGEGFLYGSTAAALAAAAGYILCFFIYNAGEPNPVLYHWEMPGWILPSAAAACVLTQVLSLLLSLGIQLKKTKNNTDIT